MINSDMLQLQLIASSFREAGHQLYLVGGCVRDHMMGIKPSDYDMTTDATPDQIKPILAQFGSVYTIGEKFGTIGVNHPELGKVEVTTFRSEIYTPHSRKPAVAFGATLEGDLARRDFTINAMAIELTPHFGMMHDPFNGKADIENGIIRAVGDANERFDEDPLRMLRALRFMVKF